MTARAATATGAARNGDGPGDGPGAALFRDVFRRADKNDDGALSPEEFRAFFHDSVLSADDLNSLFRAIDVDGSNNLDVHELCRYFLERWAAVKDIYGAVEAASQAVGGALTAVEKQYAGMHHYEQFIVRFLLQELVRQFEAVIRPLDAAVAQLSRLSLEQRPLDADDLAASGNGAIESWPQESEGPALAAAQYAIPVERSMVEQCDRLAHLVRRLEEQTVVLTPVSVEEIADDERYGSAAAAPRRVRCGCWRWIGVPTVCSAWRAASMSC